MNTQQAYNSWATQYDTNQNKTRDLEANVLRSTLNLQPFAFHLKPFTSILEIGCGTGKNTQWLVEKAEHITAVDLSEEMLAKAKAKISSDKVVFKQADITQDWNFASGDYDLVTFSLVLEHINDLEPVLKKAAGSLRSGGHVYIGELHPFKQYSGSKARFETEEGLRIVDCFNHHISDFVSAAEKAGLKLVHLDEHFDDEDRTAIPRILALLFERL